MCMLYVSSLSLALSLFNNDNDNRLTDKVREGLSLFKVSYCKVLLRIMFEASLLS